MTDWCCQVPPDIEVVVRARRKPALLSRVLGEETGGSGEVSLVLDLAARGDKSRRASLSGTSASRALDVRGVYKAIPWSCRISGGESGRLTLAFSSPILREYLALHVAMLPALQRLLLDRGIALITGATFDLGGGATILAGMTGCGKTSLLLGAHERGARLLGDEYVGLGGDSEVTPVVRALALRRATLALAPRAHRRLSPARRLALRVAELTARLTRGRLEPLVHISPAELGAPPSSGARTPARRLFWLEPKPKMEAGVLREPMDARDAAEKLAIMQAVHSLAYGDLGALLDAARVGRTEAATATRWRETVESGLRGIACSRLTFPAGHPVSSEVLEHVLRQS